VETQTTYSGNEPGRSYEELPYESGPHYPTHPDCLATIATLMGMRPAEVGCARVLELGCGNGGNLIPMAATLPQSRFLGVDLSPRHIADGVALIQKVGLDNIELRAANLLDVSDDIGTFDYIICHGVYSWVPAAVRDKILCICRDQLAPQGVAYISYNTYPGWHFRGVAKDMLHFHTRHLQHPAERLAEARGLLNFLVQSIPDNQSPYARVIRSEAEEFQREPDYYLVHEFLDEVNQPFYFYQFIEAAAEKGLQFLAEAWHHTWVNDLPPQVEQTIRDISPNLVHVEQYLDFLQQRTFRRTLLCHDSVTISRVPAVEQVLDMSVSAMAWPIEDAHQDSASDILRFRTAVNQVITTNHPAAKSVFLRLWELHPRCTAVRDLFAHVRSELDRRALPLPRKDEDLVNLLVRCFLANSLMLHVHPPQFASVLSNRPEAPALCRVQAGLGQAVANRWHRPVKLNELDRQVLVRLDGKHSRRQLVEEIGQLLDDHAFAAETQRPAAHDAPWPPDGAAPEGLVDVSLQRLLSHAFLIA